MKRVAAILATTAIGCLSVPDSPTVECQVTADCDTAHGEVCDEGVCYGNPPPGPFAALLTPPSERKHDAVAHEFTLESLPADGLFGDLALAAPVSFSGQVVCPNECSETALGASIVATRPSKFVGGPTFRQVFTSDSATGAFEIEVPPVEAGEAPYTITIVPGGRDTPSTGARSLAELVPPLHTQLALDNNLTGKAIDLGGTTPLPTISGSIVDIHDNPVTNYRIVALGRWEPGTALAEVSTVQFITQTSGNTFELKLSEGVIGSVELVAQPFGPVLQPTLHLSIAQAAIAGSHKLVAPDLGSGPSEARILVQGTNPGGQVAGVIGTHVTVTGSIAVPPTSVTATFSAEGDTDSSGTVKLELPTGDFEGNYTVSAVPPGNANVGVMFQHELDFPGSTTLKLPARLAITGTVRDATGEPLAGVQVTAHPSLRFTWSLAAAPQAFITGVPAASTVTLDTGEFVLFVDPFLDDGDVDTWGFYDLELAPATGSDAPAWALSEVEIPRDTTLSQLSLGDTTLPDAAHIHGNIVDSFGDRIEGAELKLFRISDPVLYAQFCSQLQNPPATCPVPAFQLGRGVSDVDGVARLTLPR